jgi:hypothetical protein
MTAASILGRAIAESKGKMRNTLIIALTKTQGGLPQADFKPISDIARARILGELFLARRKWELALQQFRKAAVLESPIVEHEYLARGLCALAQHERNKTLSTNELNDALAEYAKTTSRPGQIWQWSLDYLPGYLSDETFSHVTTAMKIAGGGQQITSELESYLKRRGSSDSGLPDVEQGRQLADFWKGKQVH